MTGVGKRELESERVARVLREDIVHGRRLPGQRLVERDIAAELRVSRLPVREAIRALVADGIVIARPRSWAVVRSFTAKDVRDFAEVREALETQAFVLAAQRHDAEGIARLRAVLALEETAAAAGDVDAARDAASRFHTTTLELADNEMFTELAAVFFVRLRWLFGQHDDLEHVCQEHRTIFDAIERRDVERVRDLLPEHLAGGRRSAERRLEELCGSGELAERGRGAETPARSATL